MQNYDVGSTSIVKLAFVYEQINTVRGEIFDESRRKFFMAHDVHCAHTLQYFES